MDGWMDGLIESWMKGVACTSRTHAKVIGFCSLPAKAGTISRRMMIGIEFRRLATMRNSTMAQENLLAAQKLAVAGSLHFFLGRILAYRLPLNQDEQGIPQLQLA